MELTYLGLETSIYIVVYIHVFEAPCMIYDTILEVMKSKQWFTLHIKVDIPKISQY